ncbi:MAG: PGF-CTERM sorting domain-containing protein [Rhodobacteraceae bacterium]|nr:PGF-CTERM sorting domain-containing protein [Paracoccaceae bacterium]
MIVIFGALSGAIIGGLTAHRRKGSPADIAQYAAGFGIAFALIGLIATIALHRAMV